MFPYPARSAAVPAGFTVSYGAYNGAQQATSLTWGTHVAVSNITCEPWGAISTICGGTDCTQSQETRQYNSRLQPVLMELGNSNNLTADYCLAYNYYNSQGTPSSCLKPSEGTGNNGDILGMFRQDSVNTGYSHTFTFGYDNLDRLTSAVTTGSPVYNMTYTYDQYGNVSCDSNTGGLPCPQNQYNTNNNHITTIGGATPVNVNYDAAGNQLNDQFSNYEYDAEGRVKHSYSTGQWQYPM